MFILEVLSIDDQKNVINKLTRLPTRQGTSTITIPQNPEPSTPAPAETDRFITQQQGNQVDKLIDDWQRKDIQKGNNMIKDCPQPQPNGGGNETEPFGTNNGARLVQAIGTGAFLLERRLGTAAKASRLTTWFGRGATLLKFISKAFSVLGALLAAWDLINDWTDVFKAEEGKVRKLLMAVTNTACTGIGAVIGGFIGVVGGPPGIALGACAGAGLGNLVGNLFKSGIHQDGMINNFFERLFTRA